MNKSRAMIGWQYCAFALTVLTLISAKQASADPIFYEQYRVGKDVTLPYLGVQDPKSAAAKVAPSTSGYVSVKDGDVITVLADNISDPKLGTLVRLGLDISSQPSTNLPSDIFMTSEDFEILVNDSENLVAQINVGPEDAMLNTQLASRNGIVSKRIKQKVVHTSHGRRTVHARTYGRRSTGGNLCGGGYSEMCYRQVKHWLQDNHYVNTYLPGGTALDGLSVLPRYGFRSVGASPSEQRGRVCVYGKGGHSKGAYAGHIEVFDGRNWEGSGCRSYPFSRTGRKLLNCFAKEPSSDTASNDSDSAKSTKED